MIKKLMPGPAAAMTTVVESKVRYKAPALTKGLRILETLSNNPTGLSLTDIAKQLRHSVNEIFRMVITLQDEGYIQIGEDEKYRMTLKLFYIAHKQQPASSIVATSLPLMQKLAHEALQSCHLAVYYEGRSMIIGQVDSPERWSFSVKVGAIVGLLDTSSGNVLLAFSSQERRERMIGEYSRLPGAQAVDVVSLEGRLNAIREQGFWSAKSQQIVGVTNLVRPIFHRDSSVAAVLIVPFLDRPTPGREPTLQAVEVLLATTASHISQLMGFSIKPGIKTRRKTGRLVS